MYPYPGGHTTKLAICGGEIGPSMVYLEIQSRQVWCVRGEFFLLFVSHTTNSYVYLSLLGSIPVTWIVV